MADRQKPVEGVLHVKTQGYGFLIRDDGGEDVFISQRNMGSALHGDRVGIELWAKPSGKLAEGRIISVIERGRERIVGIFQESDTYGYVIPDNLKISKDVSVSPQNQGGARPGHKVVAEIFDWGDARRMPEGMIVEVLGYPDDPGVDVLAVMRGFGLPESFPKAVEKETENIPEGIPAHILQNRLDLRNILTFTIDPEDAKDFDDALSLEKLDKGNWQVGVHIADVSHYVPVGSATDLEALKRGTSCYLADRVVPMLPERLSNTLCSLEPRKDRMTFSVLIELSPSGSVQDYSIHETVIHSKHRLSYEQAQRLIDGKPEKNDPKEITETLRNLHGLSRQLFARWTKEGNIDFDAPEAKVILDDRGHPVQLGMRARLASHRIVESFMLLANRTVAEHIHKLRQTSGKKLPFVYRVHEKPSGKKLEQFMLFVKAMGHPFDAGKRITPKKFQTFLNEIKGTRHETVIEEVALRSMMKAQYTTGNIGHFGLAFKHYTHFTSPIRRYPDLAVHRLLKAYLKPVPVTPRMAVPLNEICKTATECEIRADKAERESIRAKQCVFMAEHVGDEYDAIISGVTGFGFFAAAYINWSTRCACRSSACFLTKGKWISGWSLNGPVHSGHKMDLPALQGVGF
jgi:ribonuclease R